MTILADKIQMIVQLFQTAHLRRLSYAGMAGAYLVEVNVCPRRSVAMKHRLNAQTAFVFTLEINVNYMKDVQLNLFNVQMEHVEKA